MLTTTLLMATCPILLAPAMHTQMWENSLVQRNVDTLREHGYTVMEPAVGRLTGPDSGAGRLPEPADIVDMAYSLLEEQKLAEEYSQRSQHSPAEGHGQAKERSQVGERSRPLRAPPRSPRTSSASSTAPNPTKQMNDQLAIEPPRNVQSIAAQSPEPRKIMGMARLIG